MVIVLGKMSCKECDVTLQLIFYTKTCPEEYFKAGEAFPFPEPKSCMHPNCLMPIAPEKHGFYSRNCISIGFAEKILIRRYYCKYCGHTLSYLPSFCLPYFQYSLMVVFICLLGIFSGINTLPKALLNWFGLYRQHLQFYKKRFLANQKRIQIVLRQLIPKINLPNTSDMIKGAQEVLLIVVSGFKEIQAFSSRFFAQSKLSFMAPCKLF